MKTGDFEFRAPLMSPRELGFMFCSVSYRGKRFMSLDIPFSSGRYIRRISPYPINGIFSLELFLQMMAMMPPVPESKEGKPEIGYEDWMIILVNAWLRMERKTRRLFRRYPKAEKTMVLLDGAGIPNNACVLEGGFSESGIRKTIDSLVGKMEEGFSYIIIERGKGFDFPTWPVPTTLH